MKILALSGSPRQESSNTSLLTALKELAPPDIDIALFDGIAHLPIFSPDLENDNTPERVTAFCNQVQRVDGINISSPEYVHAIPGGLKNAIDWLVSRDEVINKPIALLHASHRGDDMLQSLRLVLQTISQQFNEGIFLRFPLMNKSMEEISDFLHEPTQAAQLISYISRFQHFVEQTDH